MPQPPITTLTREQLYEQVWSGTSFDVARRLRVPHQKFLDICLALSVPRPSRGYWQKLRAGKPVERPALPPLDGPMPAEQALLSCNTPASGQRASRAENPDFAIPKTLRNCHPIISDTLVAFKTLKPYPTAGWDARPTGCVWVSKGAAHRALCFMQAVIRACQARGWRAERLEGYAAPRIIDGENSVRLILEEPRAHAGPGGPERFKPSGRLTFEQQ